MPTNQMILYKANIVHTPTPNAFEVLHAGFIAVGDDGRIEGIYNSFPTHLQGAEVTDFGDKLLIPAMNDLHLHAPQFCNMGKALDLQLLEWLQKYTFPEESRFADIKYADAVYQHFVHVLWKNGTMRSAIFATIHPEATTLLADKLASCGLGAMIGLVGMNRNCPEYLSNTTEQVIDGTLRLMKHLENNPLVHPIITPRFVPSCTDEMLDALGALAAKYNLPVQSHLSENTNEVDWVKELEPESKNYGDAYYRHGLFGHTPTLMAHCCYTDGEELELLRNQGVYVVHCPTSNCNIASGMAHIRHFLDYGVNVALGSDISGGHTMSMFSVIKYTLQVSKLIHAQTEGKEHFLSLSEAFWLATKSGGSFFGKVGSFEKGYEFDALVIDDNHGILSTTCHSASSCPETDITERLERFIYLGDDRNITHRFCCGKEVAEPLTT